MKVFVSGAAGFIGKAVTAELARRGHRVIAFDSRPYESGERVEGNVKYMRGDLLRGGRWRSEILSCDKVISLTKPLGEVEEITVNEIKEYAAEHVEEVSSLLEAMAEGQAKTALVTYDTLCLGDRKGKLITEVGALNASGFCRPLSDSFGSVREMASEGRLEVISVFPAMVYGDGGWFRELVENIRRGDANIVGPRNNYLSLISLDDCAALYADIAERVSKSESFILSDNSPVRQGELIRFICDALGAPAPEATGFDAYAKKFGRLLAETMSASIRVSGEKAIAALGHELKYPRYEEGVMDVLESMGIKIHRMDKQRAA